jgi:hypothetical protein
VVLHHKAKNIKFNFCCYNVQISLIMSQQIQSGIFRTKMIQNALWYQITYGQNECYVLFWDIAPKHWICMDRRYCN